jgi:hypothetical protein
LEAEFEERRAAHAARRARGLEQRKYGLSIPSMRSHDARDRFMRCLISFYGEARLSNGPAVNPEDLPRKLGQADEFWREWERWELIGAAERERAAAQKAQAAKQFSEFF